MRGASTLVALVAATLALAAAPALAGPGGAGRDGPKLAKRDAARPGPMRIGTGIVQAVRPHALVVRQLDGRTVRVLVGPRTKVSVDGARASLADVQPGFVVRFAGRAGRSAQSVQASDPAATARTAAGPAVQSVSADAVVLTTQAGATLTIPIGARTRVTLDGSAVSIAEIRPGDQLIQVAGTGGGKKPARVLRFRRPG
jgi:hypothetical protein